MCNKPLSRVFYPGGHSISLFDMTIIKKQSSADFPINPILQNRWSPRALDETVTITNEDLLAILEAGRWAPSAFNDQPWRYFVGQRGDQVFNKILNGLSEFNQAWAKRAAVLILGTGTKQYQLAKHHHYLNSLCKPLQ